MPTFTIDPENNVTVFGSLQEIPENGEGTEIFNSIEELNELATKWPGSRLVEVWNSLPGVEPVQRFTSRKTAVARIWKAIQHLQLGSGIDRRKVKGKKANARKKASKAARVIALLRQPTGASLKTIMRATGWQAHSVRGFISGQLGKKLGLRVHSIERDGERVYTIKG